MPIDVCRFGRGLTGFTVIVAALSFTAAAYFGSITPVPNAAAKASLAQEEIPANYSNFKARPAVNGVRVTFDSICGTVATPEPFTWRRFAVVRYVQDSIDRVYDVVALEVAKRSKERSTEE